MPTVRFRACRSAVTALVAGLALLMTGSAHAAPRVVASPATCGPAHGLCPAQVTLGPGSWCWFADPRAVHIDRDGINEVIVGWLSPTGQVMLESIDAAGHAETVVVSRTYADDHNSPAISVEPDNRITVYWSAHNGRHLFYETTRRAGDITSWQPYGVLDSNTPGDRGFTYPNPVILSAEANRHYLFWRGGDWEPSYSTRTASGVWGPARVVINAPSRRPYMKVASNGANRIALAFTNGHPDNDVTSIYYAELRGGTLYSAAGRRLGVLGGAPIHPSAATAVYDARANGNVRSWLQDVALDHAGHPVILYSIYPRGQRAQYWYARWDGRRWLRHFMATAGPPIAVHQPHYLGGAVLDHARAGIVYLSAMVGAHHQLQRWVTDDGGHSWSLTQLTTGTASEVRPVVAQEMPGTSAPASTIFALRGVYHDYWHFRTSVVMLSSRFSIVRDTPTTAAPSAPSDPGGTPAGGD
jgi:hypothetical protein